VEMGKQFRVLWIILVISVLIACYASAEVVVFKTYETSTTLEKGQLRIEREIALENVGSNPIIPGELHFKLHEIKKGDRVASVVNNLAAKNDYNKVLKTRKIETKEETDLVVSVWEPVLEKFSYVVLLSYELEFKPKGLLFYEIKVPLEETTIPIKSQTQNLYLPAKYRVTYAPDAKVKTSDDGRFRVVTWENREEMVVEYTRLPLPKMGIRAVNVFWIVVILTLLITTFLIHRRLRS